MLMLRGLAVQALESKSALIVEQEARKRIDSLCEALLKGLDEGQAALDELKKEMLSAKNRLEKRLKKKLDAGDVFRQSAADWAALDWACAQFSKPAEWQRMALLDEREFLVEWHKLDARKIESGLLAFVRDIYQPVLALSLEEILSKRLETDTRTLWLSLSQGATPLLRPDFDHSGGAAQTFKTQFWLSADPKNSLFAPFLREPLSTWQALSIGETTLCAWVCVRHGIPFDALDSILERGRQAFEKLEQTGQQEMQIGETGDPS